LALWALGVGRTCLGLLHTADHRGGVGDEGEGAGALGPVVHHLALGVGATGIASAGVGAAVVDAGVGLGTVGVCPAPHDTHLVETYVTQETVIVNPTRQHAKPLKTPFIDCTVFIRGTGRHADSVSTLHRLWTVRGTVASGRNSDAFHFRISREVLRTNTLLSVILNTAECIYSTGSLDSTRVFALSFVAHFIGLTVSVVGAGSCDGWLGANEFVTHTVSWAVTIHKTLLLLTPNFFIVRVPEKSLRTGADSLVTSGGALSIAATNNRPSAGVLTLKQTILPPNTGVCLVTVDIIGAARLLDTQPILTAVKRGALCGVLALADTGASVTQLVIQTLSG